MFFLRKLKFHMAAISMYTFISAMLWNTRLYAYDNGNICGQYGHIHIKLAQMHNFRNVTHEVNLQV